MGQFWNGQALLLSTEILCGGKYGPRKSLEKRLWEQRGAENANVGGYWLDSGQETRDWGRGAGRGSGELGCRASEEIRRKNKYTR